MVTGKIRPSLSDAEHSRPTHTLYAIGLLVVINMFNYMDRMVLSVLLPEIKHDLGLSDGQLGWLTGMAFALFYAAFGLPIARLADVWSRKAIVSLALVGWSAMTMLSGSATSYLQLFLFRMGVGVGEAGCIPPSHSLISDLIPAQKRAGALGWHAAGGTIGVMVGLALGGWLSEQVGWRWTFAIIGAPGLVMALIFWLSFREPVRGRLDVPALQRATPGNFRSVLVRLLSSRPYRHLLLAFGASTFAVYGVTQWLPTYYMRAFEHPPGQVGLLFGLVLGIGSATGAVSGGFIANRLIKRNHRWAAWLPAMALTLSSPLLVLLLLSQDMTAALSFNFLFAYVSGLTSGPVLSIIQTLARTEERATATALAMLAASLLGIGIGPVAVGYLSDAFASYGAGASLRIALLLTSFFPVWAAVHLFIVAQTLPSAAPRDELTQPS